MTQHITKDQIKTIHSILSRIPAYRDAEWKAALIKQYSGNGYTSTTQLEDYEADKLIADLKEITGSALPGETMRKKIIHLARTMGWEYWEGGKLKANMAKINAWAVKYGYLHKRLNAYSAKELPRLVSQMEGAYKTFLNAI